MIESPLIQEIGDEFARTRGVKLLHYLRAGRFAKVPPRVVAGLELLKTEDQFLRLNLQAATCPNLQAFEDALQKELPAPPPASTRGKRRSPKPPEGEGKP